MPVYQYKCNNEKCQRVQEVEKKVSEYDREEPCWWCGANTRIQVQLTPFHLKGSGWAHQDNTDLEGRDGYDLLQSEIDKNNDESQRVDERMQKGMEQMDQ